MAINILNNDQRVLLYDEVTAYNTSDTSVYSRRGSVE
jgi:hypothetical protein